MQTAARFLVRTDIGEALLLLLDRQHAHDTAALWGQLLQDVGLEPPDQNRVRQQRVKLFRARAAGPLCGMASRT
jgi:hypothetical protein